MIGARRVGDEQLCAAVRQNMRNLRRLEQRIDRHMDQPRTRCGERHQAGGAGLRAPARNTLARAAHLFAQPRREPPNPRIEVREGRDPVSDQQRSRIRRAAKGEMVDRTRGRIFYFGHRLLGE